MTAIPLPGGRRQFVDANGAPLEGGTVAYYQVGTLTPATTWKDIGQTIENDNPIILDALGSAVIWGVGQYREIVKDSLGNQQWDENTEAFVNTGVDVVLTFTGGPPGNGQWLGGEAITRTVAFAANFAGAYGLAPLTLPTETFIVSIQQNGSQVGTAACSTGGAWTFLSTLGAPVTFNPGDRLDFYGPSTADASVADFGLTLAGNFVPS